MAVFLYCDRDRNRDRVRNRVRNRHRVRNRDRDLVLGVFFVLWEAARTHLSRRITTVRPPTNERWYTGTGLLIPLTFEVIEQRPNSG